MILTLIILTSFLNLAHTMGLQEWVIRCVSLPAHYYTIITWTLVALRIAMWIYGFIPAILESVAQVQRVSQRIETSLNQIRDLVRRKPKGPAKRSYSTRTNGDSLVAILRSVGIMFVNRHRWLIEYRVRRLLSGSTITRAALTKGSTLKGTPDKFKDGSKELSSSLNLLELLKNRYVEVHKMIPLSDKIGTSLFNPLSMNIIIAKGRLTRLAGQINHTHDFIKFILKTKREMGITFTVKYLKGCQVALQKAIGQNPLLSLRQLEPELPMYRLCNGLPPLIPYKERHHIRLGDPSLIRFWSGLFGIYRVLKMPGKAKLATITDPFSGDFSSLKDYIRMTRDFKPFKSFLLELGPPKEALAPKKFMISRSASPSNTISFSGILTDAWILHSYHPVLWGHI